jgi:enoyl-CoA hydratase
MAVAEAGSVARRFEPRIEGIGSAVAPGGQGRGNRIYATSPVRDAEEEKETNMGNADTSFENVLVSREGNVATITLNRTRFFNAMSPELMADLGKAVALVDKDDGARAVIIQGAGPHFCAGGDVKEDVAEVSGMTSREYREYVQRFFAVHRAIYSMQKPVLAAIKGYAIGGGCDLAMSCDIRIAADNARMGNAYIRMGIVPELGGMYFLPRLVGLGNAKLLLFTGDFIDANEALRMGLVQKVVPEAELDKTARELAQRLANGPTLAIGMTKLALNKSVDLDLENSTDYCQAIAVGLFQTQDHKEAYTAFLEKRKPVFRGK